MINQEVPMTNSTLSKILALRGSLTHTPTSRIVVNTETTGRVSTSTQNLIYGKG